MSIPGLPGAYSPTFRTHDRRFVGFDRVVHEVVERLAEEGLRVAPRTAKHCIQVGRRMICEHEGDFDTLTAQVSARLRRSHILFHPDMVKEVLTAYTRLVAELDVAEIMDLE